MTIDRYNLYNRSAVVGRAIFVNSVVNGRVS